MYRQTIGVIAALGWAMALGCVRGEQSDLAPTPGTTPPGPVITGVTPPSGDVAGGTALTIQGTGFITGATVTVGGTSATSVTVLSSVAIAATTPAGAAGPANVRVTNPDTQAATLTGGFTYTSSGGNAPPTFTSVTPTSGPTAGGTVITVAGTGFYTGVTVTVGGAAATGLTLVSGSSLTCTTPAGSAGAANVVVTNLDAQAATGTGAFTYVAPPSISGINPANGPQSGGITVTISGTAFVTGATVTFGASTAAVTSLTATAIEVTLPSSASSGAVTVTVTNPDTQSDTTSFTFDPPPAPTGVTPNNGVPAGGNTVTVTGTNFVNGGGLAVTFAGNAATGITWLSSTQIQCQPPAGTGTVSVAVTNPDGQIGTAPGAYTYNPAPTVTAVNANTGPAAGGTTVTITGTNFVSGATVTFGGAAATSVTVSLATQLRCDTPAGTGTVTVVVTNPDTQSGLLAAAFTYTSGGSALTVTNVQPGSGTVNGGTPVTITGTGFLIGATATFGGNLATGVMVLSASTIVAATPAGTGNVTVTVNNPGSGSANWGTQWSYTAAGTAPTISSLTPSNGPAAGGTVVTVAGTNFGTAPAITINGIGATVTGSSATSVTITTPAALHCVAGGAQPVTATDTTTGETSAPFSGFTYRANQTEAITTDLGLPDVVIDGAGNHHVVFETVPSGGGNDIQYRRSSDGGRTWNTGGITSGRVTQTSTNSTNARIAARGNTVFIVWMEAATNTSCDYVYSTDNGANWTTIASLPANTTTAVVGFPDVTLDGNGRVYVVWLESGNVGPWGTDIDVWTASGSVTGIGSATPAQISGTGNFCSQPALDADGNGNAIAAWHATGNGPVVSANNRVRWSRTTNSGTAWSTAASLSGGTTAPSSVGVALLGSSAVIAYQELTFGTTTTYGVESYYSKDTGQSWSSAVTILAASTTVVNSTAIAVDAGGYFGVAWSEVGASQTDIYCTRSSDNGLTWTKPVAFAPSTNASTQPRVAAGSAGAWAHVWSENIAGINSIFHW